MDDKKKQTTEDKDDQAATKYLTLDQLKELLNLFLTEETKQEKKRRRQL